MGSSLLFSSLLFLFSSLLFSSLLFSSLLFSSLLSSLLFSPLLSSSLLFSSLPLGVLIVSKVEVSFLNLLVGIIKRSNKVLVGLLSRGLGSANLISGSTDISCLAHDLVLILLNLGLHL